MKKARNIVVLVLAPLFSAVAVCGLIFMFGFEIVRKVDFLAFLYVGRSSTYQVLITIGLLWASFYLLVLVVFPGGKYREALTRLSKRKICTAVIGLVGPISFYAFFKVDGLIGLLIQIFAVMAIPFCFIAIIPALLIETACYAYVITDTGKIQYWKSLTVSVFFIMILPLLIVFGMELVMATPAPVVNCAVCECPTAEKPGRSVKGEGKPGEIHKPDAVEKRQMTKPEQQRGEGLK